MPYRIVHRSRLYDAAAVFMAAILGGCGILALILFIPIFAIWTYHKRKIEEVRARRQISVAEETRMALEQIRKEINALRDTTTQYDVSFDTALQRIESRVGSLEGRVHDVEQRVRRLDGETVPAARG